MLITLNNGRTIDISFEQFDSMSDREFGYFMDSDNGEVISNPFYKSQIDNGEQTPKEWSFDDYPDTDE